MGKHHRPEPGEKPAWPTVDPDELVQRVQPVRPYVQDMQSISVVCRAVVDEDTPTVPNAVLLAGLAAIEEGDFGTSKPGEHEKHPPPSRDLRRDQR